MVEINPFSALSKIGQANTDRKTIAENFETFLTLLTTQLQNQNPLDPLDTNQFTQQLVQFTEVEQAVKANSNLETLSQLTAANTITNAVAYIGREVTIGGTTAELQGGLASWTVTASGSSPAATVTVLDANGQPVFSESRPIAAGQSSFVWNGQTSQGGTAPNGTYSLVVNADNGSGGSVSVTTASTGVVDGVDLSGNEPVLTVGGREIKLDEITSIKAVSGS